MSIVRYCFILFFCTIFFSCASSYKTYKADKKFAREPLQQDFTLLRNILEQNHPALYWYTPKEKMDFYTLFDGWIIKDKIPTIEQQHYVVACLARGGVFGSKDDKKEQV